MQIVLQTPLICDGLRRCSEDMDRQREKPGRSHITFLLLSNLLLYFWGTVRLKSGFNEVACTEFYGEFIFNTVRHVTTPLTLFYRFHSAVALSDIWNGAYKPGDHAEMQRQDEEFQRLERMEHDADARRHDEIKRLDANKQDAMEL